MPMAVYKADGSYNLDFVQYLSVRLELVVRLVILAAAAGGRGMPIRRSGRLRPTVYVTAGLGSLS